MKPRFSSFFLLVALSPFLGEECVADQVIVDDLIVGGSICGGVDCANGESFGFDSLRLRENNLRIHFQDTSNSASFPSNDWRILINDSFNGGANYFGIEDSNRNTVPFRVEAGAEEDSLYVGQNAQVGVGTNSPQASLHAVSGDCPGLLLEKDGSAGFTPQNWEMRNSGSNLEFISDGNTVFSICSSAPADSLTLDCSGNLQFSNRRRLNEDAGEEKPQKTQLAGITKASEFVSSETVPGTATASVTLPEEIEGEYMVFLTANTASVFKHFTPNVVAKHSKGFRISLGDSAEDLLEVSWLIHRL